MAAFSAFQAMRLILLVSALYDAVGKSCHSSFPALKIRFVAIINVFTDRIV